MSDVVNFAIGYTITKSWYPPSVVGSNSGSLSSPSASSTGGSHQRPQDYARPPSQSQPSPSEAAFVIARLKDKSVEELRRILNDKDAYNSFFNSLEQVKTQNSFTSLRIYLINMYLTGENMEKEPRILELRNQCTIIKTTELAAAQEKLADLERQKEELLRSQSPSALLDKLHDAMRKADDEAETLNNKLLENEIELQAFVQKYKKLRVAYHRRALLHLAAKTTVC
ncbi:vacuolar protein-sorting-associated protein 37 1-like isoform X1 [Carex littledalei]|uniref:Vacuolar protein-sorting-associated protein 37 1-like isoform X1 n=1 Tax=Carex littledalei TaxID=544730 RepID=A0A833VSY9_9POAL|nr:vacuolar protein-sorting-associated protein 37 1-like isoform X1 [Carex littledalei]